MAEPRRDLAAVTVPDFSGAAAARFQAQALVFLACWMEYAGADALPLHLACIGTPPPSVAALSERAGARVSMHAPLILGRRPTFNTLRGLEVDVDVGSVLLADCDVLVLKPLTWLAQYTGALTAAPAGRDRLTPAQWQRIEAELGLDIPRRFHAQDVRLRLAPGRDRMPCYYNGGVVLTPRGAGLRSAWERAWYDLRAHFDPDEPDVRAVLHCDQAALAVALHRLEQQGWPMRVLAHHHHARRGNVPRRAVPTGNAALLHVTGLFTRCIRPGSDVRALLRRQRWVDGADSAHLIPAERQTAAYLRRFFYAHGWRVPASRRTGVRVLARAVRALWRRMGGHDDWVLATRDAARRWSVPECRLHGRFRTRA